MILGDARAPRPAGPATNPEERIGAPVPTGQGAHPRQVVSDQLLEQRRQADAALQGQSLEPAELSCIELEVPRHPGRHRHNHSVTSARTIQGYFPRNSDTSTVTVPVTPTVYILRHQ